MRRARANMIAETRGKLVEAARAAFGRQGYAATSMDDLTAAAGLTRGALYHHFGGKEGLLEAVVRQIDAEMVQRYEEEFARAGDPWSGFLACCRTYLRMAIEPEVRRIVLQDAPAVLGQRLRAIDAASSLAPMTSSLATLMESGIIKPADPGALARLVNGALVDAALWIAASDDPDVILDQAETAFEVLVYGLRVSEVGHPREGVADR